MKSRYPSVLLVLLVAACQVAEEPRQGMETMLPELASHADTLAFRALEASGGEMAMRSMPYLRFDFGTNPESPRRHLWDKMSGDYRLEYLRGDTSVVVLFNTGTRAGAAFRDGAPAADSDRLVDRGYSAFINDTYWLMMPVKMLDPGVSREVVADSSSSEHEVVRLWFDQVGLTPGDTYYVWVNRETGMVDRWHYVLQSGSQQWCNWLDYTELASPQGPVRLSARKECSRFVMHTGSLDAPLSVAEDMFSDPNPRLGA